MPRGLRQPATCLMVPSLPALSRPCSTTSTLLTFAPHRASCRLNSSPPSTANRFSAFSRVMPLGGSAEISSRRTLPPGASKKVLGMSFWHLAKMFSAGGLFLHQFHAAVFRAPVFAAIVGHRFFLAETGGGQPLGIDAGGNDCVHHALRTPYRQSLVGGGLAGIVGM